LTSFEILHEATGVSVRSVCCFVVVGVSEMDVYRRKKLVAIDVAVDVGSGVELTMEPPARLMR
jgi:hypothetical protein